VKGYIDMMVEYIGLLSDVDPLFVKFNTAQMLGHALTKDSYININPHVERLNLYVLLIGKSYFGRKTVIQDIISDFYPQEVMLPNESSAEKFIANLAETPDGVWFYGEFSKILKHVNKGGYLSSIAETLNDLYKYERPEYKRAIMNEEYVIKKPYPIFNTTLTPEVLQKTVEPEMMDGGLFGRLILVPGKKGTGGRKPISKDAIHLENNLKKIFRKLEKMNLNIKFDISHDGFKLIDKIEEELVHRDKVSSIAGRYGQATIKLSAIICFSELIGSLVCVNNSKNSKKSNNSNNSNYQFTNCTYITKITNFTNLTIETWHIEEAYEMIKPCIDFAETLYDYSIMNKKHIIKVREYIKDNFPIARSTLMQYCNLDKRQVIEAEQTLEEQNIIDMLYFKKRKKNGTLSKPTVYYCLYDYVGDKCTTCKYKEPCAAFKNKYKGK